LNGGRRLRGAAVAGLVWLALFSFVFTLGGEIGVWPTLPAGAFSNVDLVAGFAGGVLLLAILLWPARRPKQSAAVGDDRDRIG